MRKFIKEIKKICKKNKRVAMFVDMDGTIVEYKVYKEGEISTNTKGKFINAEPVRPLITVIKKIKSIRNIDIYILTLAKSNIIVNEKEEWLKKNMKFIKSCNWIIVNKEKNEYNKENRDSIKAYKIIEKLEDYDYAILIDDDHKILKQTQQELGKRGNVYHISSVVI